MLSANTYKDVNLLARFQSSVTANTDVGLVTRYTATNNMYRGSIKTNGASGLIQIRKIVSGTSTQLAVQTITLSGSTWYWLRFQIRGTNLSAKVWADGSSEPGTFNVSVADSALTAAGQVGFWYSLNATTNVFWVNSFTASSAGLLICDGFGGVFS